MRRRIWARWRPVRSPCWAAGWTTSIRPTTPTCIARSPSAAASYQKALDPRSKGPNELLRQGAILCEGIEDIERAYAALRTLREPPADSPFAAGSPDQINDAVLDRIEALLSPTPIGRDELARAAGLSIAETAAALLELHLAGRATLLPGGLAST